mmetsp:Transcript_14007/g.20187  ORF Transcript_14007/g.20187 Transcript_14007/m.20187 type:complete len:271 (-) Transcript_14007:94-906(-)
MASKTMTSRTKTSRTTISRLTVPSGLDYSSSSVAGKQRLDINRLTDIHQMDVQSALDQMRSLISGRPHVVYKTAYYRKQTKNHWARDDPAFVYLQAAFLVFVSLAYSVAFRASLTDGIAFLFHSLVWNWLVAGAIVATIARELANRHLTTTQSNTHVQQTVEWMYAFDIHCNSFFPCFCILYALQFFLLPIVLRNSLLSLILSNLLYTIAFSWYWYITHLGYRSLPFLTNTEVFLFPVAAILLLFVLNLVGYPFGLAWNASRLFAQIYFY